MRHVVDERQFQRVLVLAPFRRDAQLTCDVLHRGGIVAKAVVDIEELCREIEAGAGAVVLAQEAINAVALSCFHDVLNHQPAWSDLPLVVLTVSQEALDPMLERLAPIANVTFLERPVRMGTLLAAARAALRARQRQVEIREFGRRKDEFLAMLGHELRNPLAAVHNAAHILVCDEQLQLPARARRLAGIIDRQTRYLGRIVDDILDVSRVTTGKIVLEREAVDVNEIARGWLHAFKETERKPTHTVTVDVGDEPLFVYGDPVRLEQVLSNLLGNALKYTPAGGRVHLSVQRDGDEVVIRVSDNGAGIAPDVLPRVFELFTQDQRTVARSKGGLGLGLALVRSLVQMHDGKVCARSEGAGRGSEFEVRLPRITRPSETRREAEPATLPELNIVVVDDNDDGRETMQILLETEGHRVVTAADGRQAIDLILMARPDVALVDIGLPDVDGYEVARRVSAEARVKPFLVAMTGYGQPEDRRRAFDAGFDRHLVKPVQPDTLHQLLAELARRRANQAVG